eukprot:212595-Chlamydomonas_euryale.AAC.2
MLAAVGALVPEVLSINGVELGEPVWWKVGGRRGGTLMAVGWKVGGRCGGNAGGGVVKVVRVGEASSGEVWQKLRWGKQAAAWCGRSCGGGSKQRRGVAEAAVGAALFVHRAALCCRCGWKP